MGAVVEGTRSGESEERIERLGRLGCFGKLAMGASVDRNFCTLIPVGLRVGGMVVRSLSMNAVLAGLELWVDLGRLRQNAV